MIDYSDSDWAGDRETWRSNLDFFSCRWIMDDGLTKPMSQVNYHGFIQQLRLSDHDVNDGGEARSLIPHRKDEITLAWSERGLVIVHRALQPRA